MAIFGVFWKFLWRGRKEKYVDFDFRPRMRLGSDTETDAPGSRANTKIDVSLKG